jgi:glucose/arabinose dehydrogenase
MRVKWVNGKPSGDPEKFADLPSSTPSVHVSRTINVGPDGRLYVAIGSSCNVCVESDPRRTTIQVVNADGSLQPYARGLHNAIGFDWDPQTRRMWADDTGQDNLGDDFPPDEINQIEAGKHYGFPFFVAKNQPNASQPELKDATADVTADAPGQQPPWMAASIMGMACGSTRRAFRRPTGTRCFSRCTGRRARTTATRSCASS